MSYRLRDREWCFIRPLVPGYVSSANWYTSMIYSLEYTLPIRESECSGTEEVKMLQKQPYEEMGIYG